MLIRYPDIFFFLINLFGLRRPHKGFNVFLIDSFFTILHMDKYGLTSKDQHSWTNCTKKKRFIKLVKLKIQFKIQTFTMNGFRSVGSGTDRI
jgi:hypothetical protein